jgi:hypothetical protein
VRKKIAGMIRFEQGVSKKKNEKEIGREKKIEGSIMSILKCNKKTKELL